MKYVFIILVILGVVLQNSSKLIIYANFGLNRDYIAKNLCEKKDEADNCCKGSCHLKKQLDKEDKKEESQGNPVKKESEIQLFSEKHSKLFLLKSNSAIEINTMYVAAVLETNLRPVFHPPKIKFNYYVSQVAWCFYKGITMLALII